MFQAGLIILTFCLSHITCDAVGAAISFRLSPIGFVGGESGVALHGFFSWMVSAVGQGKVNLHQLLFFFSLHVTLIILFHS